jgi:hypothetical protein
VITESLRPALLASPLWRALSASALVHAGVAAVLVAGAPLVQSAHVPTALPLRATFSEPYAAPMQPIELASLQAVPVSRIRASALPRLAPEPLYVAEPDVAPSAAAPDQVGQVAAIAELLTDHSRLGPLLDREMSEYPTEIDSAVRLDDPIVVRLPAGLRPSEPDASIIVWAVVLADGSVDTALLADGDESLAEPVLAAVKAARFVPARSRLQPRDYPVSLEFRFTAKSADDTAQRVVSAASSASVR